MINFTVSAYEINEDKVWTGRTCKKDFSLPFLPRIGEELIIGEDTDQVQIDNIVYYLTAVNFPIIEITFDELDFERLVHSGTWKVHSGTWKVHQ
jgi:hypothetical protein